MRVRNDGSADCYRGAGGSGISHIRERIHADLRRLTEEARKVTGNGQPFFELLPGVCETLQVLNDHPRYQSALLTGNIRPMAYLKMELVGLESSFLCRVRLATVTQSRDLPAGAAERIRSTCVTSRLSSLS